MRKELPDIAFHRSDKGEMMIENRFDHDGCSSIRKGRRSNLNRGETLEIKSFYRHKGGNVCLNKR